MASSTGTLPTEQFRVKGIASPIQPVIPAKAGTQESLLLLTCHPLWPFWIPACAGMTSSVAG